MKAWQSPYCQGATHAPASPGLVVNAFHTSWLALNALRANWDAHNIAPSERHGTESLFLWNM